MEFINGITIEEIEYDEYIKNYSDALTQFSTNSYMIYGLLHCDIHKGNVIFSKKNNDYIVNIIDYGLVCNVNKKDLDNIFLVFKNLHNDNYLEVTKMFLYNFTSYIIKDSIEDNILINELYDIFKDAFCVQKIFTPQHIIKIYKVLLNRDIELKTVWRYFELSICSFNGFLRLIYKDIDKHNMIDAFKKSIGNVLNYIENDSEDDL